MSWGIIIYKLVQISRARRESERFIAIFWESKNLAAIHSASVGLNRSPVAQVFRAGYQELLQLTRAKRQAVGAESGFSTDLGGVENVTRAMRRQTNVEMTKLEKGITFLATTGSTCPFIGLFGTVWGIMTAFMGLSAAHYLEHPGGRPRYRRGADHDRHRPRRRDSGADASTTISSPACVNSRPKWKISPPNFSISPSGISCRKGRRAQAAQYGWHSIRDNAGLASQINVTPLVDVMLVLLIIFMVTAPIIQQGVEVNLPKVKAAALPGKEEQFIVSITRNREVYLNDTQLGSTN